MLHYSRQTTKSNSRKENIGPVPRERKLIPLGDRGSAPMKWILLLPKDIKYFHQFELSVSHVQALVKVFSIWSNIRYHVI